MCPFTHCLQRVGVARLGRMVGAGQVRKQTIEHHQRALFDFKPFGRGSVPVKLGLQHLKL